MDANFSKSKKDVICDNKFISDEMEDGEASSENEAQMPKALKKLATSDQEFEANISSASEDENTKKKLERARRFGLSPGKTSTKRVSKTQLRKSLGLQSRDFRAGWLRDTLLFCSPKKLDPHSLYSYIQGYNCCEVSWLDGSCCLRFKDHKAADRALTELSCAIMYPADYPEGPVSASVRPKPTNRTESASSSSSSSSSGSSDSSSSSDSGSSISESEDETLKEAVMQEKPQQEKELKHGTGMSWSELSEKGWVPGGRWRYGVPAKRISTLFMRYAHYDDHKEFGGVRNVDIIAGPTERVIRAARRTTLGKLKNSFVDSELKGQYSRSNYRDLDNPQDENDRDSKTAKWNPRFDDSKMDFQELLHEHVSRMSMKRKAVSSDESEDEVVTPLPPSKRRKRVETYYQSEESNDSDDGVVAWKTKSKVPRMRMYADEEQERQKYARKPTMQSRIGHRINSRHPRAPGFDLRQRLSNRH